MTRQEFLAELEARQWRTKKVYTPKEKSALAQIARNKSRNKKAEQKAQVKAYLESSKNMPRNQKGNINLKKSISIQTQHNDRTQPPSYLLESGGMGVEYNRDSREAQTLKQQLIHEASMAYTTRTGQRLQAKSYEWSAVCNIKPDSTMEQLEQFAKWVEKYYGFQCYQIAIHRDEGYIDENGQEQINHHAHLEFITLDKESGKNRIRDIWNQKVEMKKWQTRIANILQMERGESKQKSGRTRIEPRYFAKLANEIKKEEKETQINLTQKAIKDEFMQVRQVMIKYGICDKDDYKITLAQALNQALESAKDKKYTQNDLNSAITQIKQKLEQKHEVQFIELEKYKTKLTETQKILTEKERIIKETQQYARNIQQENEKNKQHIISLQESQQNALKTIENQKNNIERLEKEKMDLKATRKPNIATSGESKHIAIASPYDFSVIMTSYATTTLTEPSNLVEENELLRQEIARTKLVESEKDRALQEIAQMLGVQGSIRGKTAGAIVRATRDVFKEMQQHLQESQEQEQKIEIEQKPKNKGFER